MGRGYGDYCPIAKAAEILAERRTPLIIRSIYLRSHSFREIHTGCPRMSSTLCQGQDGSRDQHDRERGLGSET